MSEIRLRGAAEHNLQSVDLELPRGTWICVTGPSGSGKSSLVFDTLVREGQHRYLGALSARARQFFGKLGGARVASIEGLPPAMAIGQSDARASSRSTVGTLTGNLDLLRLLFARAAVDPGGAALTRSHFSFNHSEGACEACGGSGLEDRVAEDLLVADPTRSIRDGALKPTLKNGYTVYSQVTLEVMDTICRAHGFDVQTPWEELSDAQRDVIFHGTKALEVPFGKHSIESRMKWEGITARPREVGYYKGLIPVITETLQRNRNPNVLRFVRSLPCGACGGARLGRAGREAQLGQWRLPGLLALPARELPQALEELPSSEVLGALKPELNRRLERMHQLGLGHLALERESTTLSAGEAQRIRLARQLAASLSGLLIALDEPTLGLHPSGQEGMRAVLDDLRGQGNTLAVVEHDPDMVRHADHWVAIGPGAGPDGGRVVASGALPPHPLGEPPLAKATRRESDETIRLSGATLHNLRQAELSVHLGTFQVVSGPSGAGKTSLVFGTLLPALLGEEGGAFTGLEAAEGQAVRAVDARPIGRSSRSTPATWSGLMDLIRKRFAETEVAQSLGMKAGHFSFNNKSGRCAACEGLGTQVVGLHLLRDVELSCPSCGGSRYAAETLQVRLRGKSIAEVLALSVREARDYFSEDPQAHALCRAMDDLGLGYLALGFPSNRLSRGEGQRVKLATLLGNTKARPTLVALDEPDRGLHPEDVQRLLACIDELIDAGHTVLAISHHRHLWAAADTLVELQDGVARVVPPADGLPLSSVRDSRPPATPPASIELEGVRTNSLQGVDVSIPHRKLTAICGVSGSGKSSLAFDTLASEGWLRFAESLPFQVRRFMKRMPRPELEAARGLGPVLALRQNQTRAGRRSTVATQTEIGPTLRLLWSRAGTLDGQPCGLSAEHFSPDRALGACQGCEGSGEISRCDPRRLVTNPDRSILAGAMDGTRVGRYLGEPDGQFIATLKAAGPGIDWERPWEELPDEEQRFALHGGDGSTIAVRWELSDEKRAGEGKQAHEFEARWLGFLELVERESRRRVNQKTAAQWAEPLAQVPCPACEGARLRPEVAAVSVGGLRLPDVLARPLDQLIEVLEGIDLNERQAAVFAALMPELSSRVDDLRALGLGHLELSRSSRSLSAGELQRTRLASVLRSGLSGVTIVLDEPTSGLHVRDVEGLLELLRGFRDRGNTVVVVEHEPRVLRAADHLIEMGPGAGVAGGQLVASGEPATVLAADGPTAIAMRGAEERHSQSPAEEARLRLRGCRANHLRSIDVELPLAGLVAVTGVSGSGKSSLVFDVLEASIRARRAVECDTIEVDGGFDHFKDIRTSRRPTTSSTILAALDLLPSLQWLYSSAPGAEKLPRQAFSFASPAGRCKACNGSGRERIAMDFMADLELDCPVCDGHRYRPEVLAVHWKGLNVADFLSCSIAELLPMLPAGRLRSGFEAISRVGLDYLSPGRRPSELSGGERQRVALASSLAAAPSPGLYLLDEPATGLHEADIARLGEVFRALAVRGDLVVIAEHRISLIALCDHVIDLGPESGVGGGQLIATGPPGGLEVGATAEALRGDLR